MPTFNSLFIWKTEALKKKSYIGGMVVCLHSWNTVQSGGSANRGGDAKLGITVLGDMARGDSLTCMEELNGNLTSALAMWCQCGSGVSPVSSSVWF